MPDTFVFVCLYYDCYEWYTLSSRQICHPSILYPSRVWCRWLIKLPKISFCFSFVLFQLLAVGNFLLFSRQKWRSASVHHIENCQITCGVCVWIFTWTSHVHFDFHHSCIVWHQPSYTYIHCTIVALLRVRDIWFIIVGKRNGCVAATDESRSLVFRSMNWSEFVARIPSSRKTTRCTN